MQLDIRAKINTLKSSFTKLKAAALSSMCIAKVLEITFSCLVADRAIQWMVY
jgi:hypothetical protein